MPLTEAEAYLLESKNSFFWSILITSNAFDLYARVCVLNHDDTYGFFITTHVPSNKIGQIESNPYVTLSLASEHGSTPIVVHCTAQIVQNATAAQALWKDEWKKAGFSGPDDPKLRLIFITVHSLEHENNHYNGVFLDPLSITFKSPPEIPSPDRYQTKDAYQIINKTITQDPVAHLITWNGTLHSDRLMQTLWDNTLGPYHVTMLNSRKVAHIRRDPHVNILFVQKSTMTQVAIHAIATVRTDSKTLSIAPDSFLKQFGFQKEDATSWCIITYQITKVSIHDLHSSTVTDYWCQQTDSLESKQDL